MSVRCWREPHACDRACWASALHSLYRHLCLLRVFSKNHLSASRMPCALEDGNKEPEGSNYGQWYVCGILWGLLPQQVRSYALDRWPVAFLLAFRCHVGREWLYMLSSPTGAGTTQDALMMWCGGASCAQCPCRMASWTLTSLPGTEIYASLLP